MSEDKIIFYEKWDKRTGTVEYIFDESVINSSQISIDSEYF